MNTDTGNIFLIGEQPLAENEVELKANELAELFPIRDLGDRLDLYRRMQQARLAEFPSPARDSETTTASLKGSSQDET